MKEPNYIKNCILHINDPFCLARFIMTVLDLMQARNEPIVRDDEALAEFYTECIQWYNSEREEGDFITPDELTELIRIYREFEAKELARIAACPR